MPTFSRCLSPPCLAILLLGSGGACSVPEERRFAPGEEGEAPTAARVPARLTRAFQARLDELHAEHGFVGATAAFILPNGEVGAAATGLADVERDIRMTVENRMPAASIGKTFAAATALSMVQDGLLGLDDEARTWLGEEPWFHRLANHETITLRHLLTHSSGLADHVYQDGYRQAARRNREGPEPDPDAWFTPRQLVGFILDEPALFPAGEGYAYTDTGYVVAGLMLEAASGGAYTDEAQRRIFDRIDLPRTEAQLGRHFEGLASGYMGSDSSWGMAEKVADDGALIFNPRTEWTGGGYVSNPQDLVRWAKILYEERALARPYLGEMLQSGYRGADAKAVYGLGVFIVDDDLGRQVGHGGIFPGWRSSMYYHPERRVAVALQVNQIEPDVHNILRRELFEVVLDRLPD